ncbi:MAG: stage III sporulation protein AB [Clostridia bacterium]|nr:stage III sporulation protein AB [Clostridia bacterium]
MFKIAGSIMVVVAAFLIGFFMRKELKDACDFTIDMIDGLNALKEEIRYNSDYILNSISKSAMLSGSAKPFFDKVYSEIKEGNSAEQAFSEASLEIKNENVRSVIFNMSKMIGKTDAVGQQNLLSGCIEKLVILHEQQSSLLKERGNLYPKLGAVSGILITILLF